MQRLEKNNLKEMTTCYCLHKEKKTRRPAVIYRCYIISVNILIIQNLFFLFNRINYESLTYFTIRFMFSTIKHNNKIILSLKNSVENKNGHFIK